ncbi:helix-turn-helix transcriptional regulator [Thermophilibacter sp.]
MEVGRHIRELRGRFGLSQDDLAARVYVSRQTISSWENARTYPDLQSLVLLARIFGVTVDSLIEGDVETMTKTVDADVRTMRHMSLTMTGFLALMVAALAWLALQLVVWDWPLAQTAPTAVLALVLWGIALAASCRADRIKRDHDLVTYHEILSFLRGKPVDRETERGRRGRLIPAWMRVVRTAGLILLGLAMGAFVGYVGSALLDLLAG